MIRSLVLLAGLVSCHGYQLQPSIYTEVADRQGGVLGEDSGGGVFGEGYEGLVGIQFELVPPTTLHYEDRDFLARLFDHPDLVADQSAVEDVSELVLGMKAWQFFGTLGFLALVVCLLAWLQRSGRIHLPLISKKLEE